MPLAKLVSNVPSGTGLAHLTFDRPAGGYVTPGQFVVATLGDERAYLALASAPGAPVELLVKAEGALADQLVALAPGAEIDLSDAQGHGFSLAVERDRPLVAFVNGSALSAVRPVLAAEVAAGLPRPVHLLYGVLSPEHAAFAADRVAWARAGVDVQVVVHPEFVQDRAAARGLVHPDVEVLACGVPPMIDAVKAAYAAAGAPEGTVLTNW